jgi:hypothetical protein
MTKTIHSVCLLFFGTFFLHPSEATPDKTVNRYASAEDAAYWPTVNEGDFLFFTGNNDGGDDICASPSHLSMTLPVGGKILIHGGDYERIFTNSFADYSKKEISKDA